MALQGKSVGVSMGIGGLGGFGLGGMGWWNRGLHGFVVSWLCGGRGRGDKWKR